jgi:hypothetical protein
MHLPLIQLVQEACALSPQQIRKLPVEHKVFVAIIESILDNKGVILAIG